MADHEERVAFVTSRVRDFWGKKQAFRIYHGATNSTRASQWHRDNMIDTSSLNQVLAIDLVKKTAVVEPNVPMDALVAATLPRGLVPLVVMEFPGITAGGGFSGTSGESSSFRHGAFDATVNWIEIVLPNGDLTMAYRTKEEKTDLFWGAASSFGTLGVVTALEVQLREAKPYVQLTYSLCGTSTDVQASIKKETDKLSVDYVDAIMFSRNCTVICSGRLVDGPPEEARVQRLTRSIDPWFYVHVRRILQRLQKTSAATVTEYIPLTDYLFRYDRGAFWAAVYSFRYFLMPFNRITRFFLNPLMHTRTMYRALHRSGLADTYIVQDVGVPYDKVGEFVDWLHAAFHIYPIWLCPLRLARDTPNAGHGLHSDFARLDARCDATSGLMNFGIWGPGSFDRREFVRLNRLLESKVQELGGKKWLYARSYYTEDEFWAHYDRHSYDAVRRKYGADWMPSVFDKVVHVDFEAEQRQLEHWVPWLLALFWSLWPLKGIYGVFAVLLCR